jgi:hypothetical protein
MRLRSVPSSTHGQRLEWPELAPFERVGEVDWPAGQLREAPQQAWYRQQHDETGYDALQEMLRQATSLAEIEVMAAGVPAPTVLLEESGGRGSTTLAGKPTSFGGHARSRPCPTRR